ncbi:hypothetical protein JXA32_08240 [Candidatus Sumerlaeota bacterium]|nr:hypothetical protein [Candidatus Sumerlaeota bacterium]
MNADSSARFSVAMCGAWARRMKEILALERHDVPSFALFDRHFMILIGIIGD